MKMKRKGFHSRQTDGFTLVELIAVIAILAILGAVAVPAYSGYIQKANEAADDQLIGEITQALTLGAYAKTYAPGSIVGAVGLDKESNATGAGDIEEMMSNTFGENWKETLRLKSDKYIDNDKSKILAAMQAAKAAGNDYFDSVPESSYFATAGNTEAIVEDVDQIATALQGVLEGKAYAFGKFWGDDFRESVEDGGLADTWNKSGNDQMAANLTVFAAANQIKNIATSDTQADKNKVTEWVTSWNGSATTVSSTDAYCAELVMQFGQCVAAYNYILAEVEKDYGKESRYSGNVQEIYDELKDAMTGLKNPERNYLDDFNQKISDFWTALDDYEEYKNEWVTNQAQKDAEALLASMIAVNSLESDYVNKDQSEILNTQSAFKEVGAAKILDTMIAYSTLENLPEGACAVVLTLSEDGSPVILVPDEENGTK